MRYQEPNVQLGLGEDGGFLTFLYLFSPLVQLEGALEQQEEMRLKWQLAQVHLEQGLHLPWVLEPMMLDLLRRLFLCNRSQFRNLSARPSEIEVKNQTSRYATNGLFERNTIRCSAPNAMNTSQTVFSHHVLSVALLSAIFAEIC